MNSIERNVLEMIGENPDSPDVFTDGSQGMAQIRDSINDAIEEISMLTGSVTRKYHMLLRTNQGFYRLNFKRERFGWITDAWLISIKRRLEQTDTIRLNAFNHCWMKDTGTPEAYGQIGKDVFYCWPRPSGELVLELSCVVIPDRYENDYDRIKLRDVYQWAASDFAIGEYYASRGDAKQAIEWHNRYLERLGMAGMYPKTKEKKWGYKTEKQTEGATG
jgi:phage pi2 protein 07